MVISKKGQKECLTAKGSIGKKKNYEPDILKLENILISVILGTGKQLRIITSKQKMQTVTAGLPSKQAYLFT